MAREVAAGEFGIPIATTFAILRAVSSSDSSSSFAALRFVPRTALGLDATPVDLADDDEAAEVDVDDAGVAAAAVRDRVERVDMLWRMYLGVGVCNGIRHTRLVKGSRMNKMAVVVVYIDNIQIGSIDVWIRSHIQVGM